MDAQRRKCLGTPGVCFAVLFLFSLWFPAFAGAGWYIGAKTMYPSLPSSSGSRPQLTTYVSQNKIKYETRAWTQIIDLRNQRLLVINHIGRIYWEGPIDEYITASAKQAQEMRARRDKVLQQMPPERRKAIERRGGPFDTIAPSLEITVTQTSEEKTVAGHQARKYIVQRNGEPYEETWVTKDIDLGTDVDMQRLKEFIAKLQAARTTPPGAVLAELTELIDEGYPVKTVNLISNIVKEVVQAERRDVDSKEFTAPKGYAQRALTEVRSPRSRAKRPDSKI